DANNRQQRIDASRLMNVDDNGITVFQGTDGAVGFMAVADTGNAGSVTFKGPDVVDNGAPGHGEAFSIVFGTDADGQAQYTIQDASGQVLQPARPYTSGQGITHAGLSLTLEGQPAAGDKITVDKAENMNTDLFRTFEKALAVLEKPAATE